MVICDQDTSARRRVDRPGSGLLLMQPQSDSGWLTRWISGYASSSTSRKLMNLLTELLPGARQLRAPMAVGYLWLLVAWINIPRLPSGFDRSSLVHRAASDLHHMSPV